MRSELPIHPLIDERVSPRAFSDRPVAREHLDLLFEAARWAPSSMNDQPWHFIVALRGGPGHAEMLAAMNASNRVWADKAPVLVVNITRRAIEKLGVPNPHAWHDLGLALGQLTLQATALGLGVRHLAGIDPERARRDLHVPPEYDVVSMMVIGQPGDPAELPEAVRAKVLRPSTRRPLERMVSYGRYPVL